MQVLTRLGMVLLTALSSMNSASQPKPTDFTRIAQQLQLCARDLRDVGRSMQAHARTPMLERLSKDQETSLTAERRDLEATADAALKLAMQIDHRENKARAKTLTRADMDSLGVAAHALTARVNQRSPGPSASKKLTCGSLNEPAKQIDSMPGAVRNQRQMASTAFQNFDQKANQLYNLLSSVMKAFNEMRAGTVRNML